MLKNGSIVGNVNNPTRAITRGLWDNDDVFLGSKSGIWPAPTVFSEFTFTNGTNIGPTGPSSANLLAAYNTSTYPFLTDSEIFTVSNGIQVLRLTTTGVYRIEAYGAEGGGATTITAISGKGAIMKGDFSLSAGAILYILVGQQGQSMGYASGGGGGTFVGTGASLATSTALIVAGGGGGGGNSTGSGRNGSTATDGGAGVGGQAAGTAGNGGSGGNSGYGESGAGFLTNSTSTRTTWGFTPTIGVTAFRNGGIGSGLWSAFSASSCNAGGGGFGGGGAGGCDGAGGGGGYSGGGGGGGGGGSINTGTNQTNTTGHTGHGKVIITKL